MEKKKKWRMGKSVKIWGKKVGKIFIV